MRGRASGGHTRDMARAESPAVTEYLAECLWPGVTEAQLAEVDERVRTNEAGADDAVRYLGTVLMPNDEVVFFVFTGPSASAVRAVAMGAEIPFERIVPSLRTSNPTDRRES
jgi:hypothetical protein